MSEYEKIQAHGHPPADSSDEEGAESDDDDFEHVAPRTSTELRHHDREILEHEEETEKLLVGDHPEPSSAFKNMFRGAKHRPGNQVTISDWERRQLKREARRERRRKRRASGPKEHEEESELMYEMEEGQKNSSDSSGDSSEVDKAKLTDVRIMPKVSRKAWFKRIAALHVIVLVAFVGLVYGAYKASTHRKPASPGQQHDQPLLRMLSNGTTIFAPTTILISLDGFRADFLHRDITPVMNAFIRAGVSPQYMLPSFPSVTFPNHFTLVTGLYPEAHGVVGNTFWDPVLQEEFYYTDPARSMQAKWWQGEPLWVTAEHQDVRTAIHMWPGSEAHIAQLEPTYVDKYNGKEPLTNKVDRILGLLDLPGPYEGGPIPESPRPRLIAAYVPNVDQHGHLYGPNSTEIRDDIASVDTMLGDLFQGLEDRNLTSIVNIVIVSDHGMATTDTTRLIQLDDIIDMSLIEHTDGWPLYGLRPKKDADLNALYTMLKLEAGSSGNFDVYLRDLDMPNRYHFSQNERIAPLWMIPKTGWAIVTREEFDVKEAMENGLVYHPRGLHGYDHEHPLMRAIFMARGPAFPHTPGSKVDVFQNIEVYNIVCDSLGIQPKPNNGTLRLPLKPVGLHDYPPPGEIPDDPQSPETNQQEPTAATSATALVTEATVEPTTELTVAPTEANPTAELTVAPTEASPTRATETDPAAATRPVVHDGGDPDDEDINLWWAWVKGKLEGAKDWAADIFDTGDEPVAESNAN